MNFYWKCRFKEMNFFIASPNSLKINGAIKESVALDLLFSRFFMNFFIV